MSSMMVLILVSVKGLANHIPITSNPYFITAAVTWSMTTHNSLITISIAEITNMYHQVTAINLLNEMFSSVD